MCVCVRTAGFHYNSDCIINRPMMGSSLLFSAGFLAQIIPRAFNFCFFGSRKYCIWEYYPTRLSIVGIQGVNSDLKRGVTKGIGKKTINQPQGSNDECSITRTLEIM